MTPAVGRSFRLSQSIRSNILQARGGTIPPVGKTRPAERSVIEFDDSMVIELEWIGWWEKLQESPTNLMVKTCKNHGFRLRFSQENQSNDMVIPWCFHPIFQPWPRGSWVHPEAIGQESPARGSQQFDLDFHRGRDENWAQDGGENLFHFFQIQM